MQLTLNPSEVHLWLAFCGDAEHESLHARYRLLMTPEERLRGDRFYFEHDRARYRVTRALVRTVLSRYAPIASQDWRFDTSSYGQPFIANPQPQARSLSFNLTHASDLVVLAVTRRRAIGVDAENITRGALLDVADRFFAPSECEQLWALPSECHTVRFFELWTLKESYIKARGMGLSIPLHKFAFDLRTPGSVSLATMPELQDPAERWALRHLWATHEHPLALCVEREPQHAQFDLTARRVVPLEGEKAIDLLASRSN